MYYSKANQKYRLNGYLFHLIIYQDHFQMQLVMYHLQPN